MKPMRAPQTDLPLILDDVSIVKVVDMRAA